MDVLVPLSDGCSHLRQLRSRQVDRAGGVGYQLDDTPISLPHRWAFAFLSDGAGCGGLLNIQPSDHTDCDSNTSRIPRLLH